MANDNTFLRRVQISVAKFAEYILNKAPNAPNHPARFAQAKNSIMNTQGLANALAPAVVMDETVSSHLLGTTDAQVQAAVEFAAQQLVL